MPFDILCVMSSETVLIHCPNATNVAAPLHCAAGRAESQTDDDDVAGPMMPGGWARRRGGRSEHGHAASVSTAMYATDWRTL